MDKPMQAQQVERYRREVEDFRRRKDHLFATDPESPFPQGERAKFRGLRYFPVEPRYRFRVALQPEPSPARVHMVTSRGSVQAFLWVGYFEFPLEGKTARLDAYLSAPPPGQEHHAQEGSLFVPFRDATSGKETYGAARYLDLEPSLSGEYVLDFNYAYNPYCAYSEDYVCPFPPQENTLPVAIRAGEKVTKRAEPRPQLSGYHR